MLLLLNSCARHGSYNNGFFKSSNTRWHAGFYTVRSGDTLYSVAWQYGEDFKQVARWNNIKTPFIIYPGQKLRLLPPKENKVSKNSTPKKSIKSSSNPSRHQSSHPLPSKTSQATSKPKLTPAQLRWREKKRKLALRQKLIWKWPTRGKVITTFSLSNPGRKGINIAGRKGQSINAAASGTVVYSGQGLRGYGNLIIIKHNEEYFSAYAHNHKIYTKEKQKVKIGQHIADMGSTDAERNMLHFEIRKNGTPINPIKFLPQ
ncbi:Murein hydrolase activator NlpD [hydrothermal vent metagenome]|uniref:Murein hydrolase activator NlpD n=1 Tax=hydrothermal vent metagenome TaxID=652676 RepID=A0A3B1A038_9ZZZZ